MSKQRRAASRNDRKKFEAERKRELEKRKQDDEHEAPQPDTGKEHDGKAGRPSA